MPINLCFSNSFDIIVSCWSLDSRQRPRFSGLVSIFSDLLERDAGYLELSRSLSWRSKGRSLKATRIPSTHTITLQNAEEEEEMK